MLGLARALAPFPRSITGDGVRATLREIGGRLPLEIVEVPSGTAVFDWTVPHEWNIRDAWIKDPAGQKILDLADSNLHVLNYSTPVDAVVPLEELEEHVHTIPEHPDRIPYRTSYYREQWGFCMAHARLMELEAGDYHVHIDATLGPGSLTYGEVELPGKEPGEILFSTHVCHPAMANDNLSGLVVATHLATGLMEVERRHTFRFLFLPGTIGSITWLSRNPDVTTRVKHGLVIAGVGDPGEAHYKRSRRGNALIDRVVEYVLEAPGGSGRVRDFSPYGYDERQFCSPGFNLPMGCFSRTPYGEYSEYHSSADDLEFISEGALEDSLGLLRKVVDILEKDDVFQSTNPHCEPQLGRRGLYDSVGGRTMGHEDRMALLWVLNQSDGTRSLLDIAVRSGKPFGEIRWAATALIDAGLLTPVPAETRL